MISYNAEVEENPNRDSKHLEYYIDAWTITFQ